MNTLTKKEQRVFANIEVVSEEICCNRYFVFADLVDFDLDNNKDELGMILDSLVAKGYLKAFNDFDKTYRLLK